jgi:vang-like
LIKILIERFRATSRASRRSRRPHSSKDKSVSIKAPQRSRQSDSRRKEDDDNAGLDAAADDSRRWPGETDTFATSECTRISNEDLGKFHADLGARLNVSRYLNPALLSVVLTQLFAYVTPIFFLVLPKVLSESTPSLHDDCDIGCEGQIIAIAVRLFVLSLASLYLFWRTPRSKVPQINLYRTGVNFFTFLVTAVYWIFYSYKVIHWEDYEYPPIVKYSSNFVDILLFVHYLAIVLLFLRRDQEIYLLEVHLLDINSG